MNFKLWLESTVEEYSNELTEKLCQFIKTNNRIPSLQVPPIMAGSLVGGERIQYNIDPYESKLARHLQDKKNGIEPVFDSDKIILAKHEMDDLFDRTFSNDRKENNNQMIIKLAEFYKKNNNKYPQPFRNQPNRYRGDEENKLFSFLDAKRQIYARNRQGTKYEGEEQFGIQQGLPNDWLKNQYKTEEENNEMIIKLAEFYKKNNNKYPQRFRNQLNRSQGDEEHKLYAFLDAKRKIYAETRQGIKYEGEEQFGIQQGLPNDWLKNQYKREEENNEMIIKLAEFWKNNRKYPQVFRNQPNRSQGDEEHKLCTFLKNKRKIYAGTRQAIKYEGEEQFGIQQGLPTNWLIRRNSLDDESFSDIDKKK